MTFDKLIKEVTQWADDRNILKSDNAPKQLIKIMEELGETSSALLKNNEPELKDGIGDILVTVIIFAQQCGYTPIEIKNRTGKTVGGVFVKDE